MQFARVEANGMNSLIWRKIYVVHEVLGEWTESPHDQTLEYLNYRHVSCTFTWTFRCLFILYVEYWSPNALALGWNWWPSSETCSLRWSQTVNKFDFIYFQTGSVVVFLIAGVQAGL